MAKASEIVGLDCETGASLGIRVVLDSRLKDMCALRTAALDWTDPEGVHDMRVASRRLRSALKDFSPYLRESKLRSSADELNKIADALGEVRDQDVAILELKKKSLEAPADVAVGIGDLISELDTKRKSARRALSKVIAKRTLARFQTEFESALDGALKVSRRSKTVEDGSDKTGLSFREAARTIIKTNLQRLQDIHISLYAPFKTKPLHRMRIAVKRLRYATKLFAPCWTDGLAPFDKEIARLQTFLGELHDCDVWIAKLGGQLKAGGVEVATRSGASAASPASSREGKASHGDQQVASASLWLLSRFVEARTGQYRSALARWHEWEVTGFQDRLFAAIENTPPEAELPPVASSPALVVPADIPANQAS